MPFLKLPSTAMYSSGMRPASTNSRSPLPTPRLLQHVGEAVGQSGELAVGDVARRFVAEKAKRHAVAAGAMRMALDRFERHVDAAAGQAGQVVPRLLP